MIRATITILAVLCAAAGTAAAAPKVALTAIDGDLTGNMRDAVAEALDGDDLTVLGEKETNRAVDKLGDVSELSEKQAKKLSTDLSADALVMATLDKKGKAKILRFKLFVKGKKQRGFRVQFKSEKSAKFKQALREKIIDKIDEASGPAADEAPKKKGKLAKTAPIGEDDEDPNPKPKGKKSKAKDADAEGEGDGEAEGEATAEAGESDDEDTPRKGKKKTTAARGDDDDEETAIEKRMQPKHAANRVAIRLDTGVSVSGRSLQFTQRANFPEGPKKFKSSPVPGGRFELEVFPLAFGNPQSFISGLGAAVEYDKTLVLNLGTSAEADRGKKIPVNQTHFSVGGRFRLAFGKKATSPTMTLGVDYGNRRWKADRSGLTDPKSLDLPDTNYKFLAPGLGFRIPLGSVLAFVMYGEAMFISSAGPIQKADSYGKAKVFGAAGEAGFDVVLGNRFAMRFIGELTQIGYTFVGAGGAEANNRDGDPASRDVGGAADRSYGGTATLAVLY
ncbi:MAG: hypothetical protein H0T89_15450 [Deltaproteobacteria bacterium]|nr:hypothetical protein [Deltaproteobacteria bacterium]